MGEVRAPGRSASPLRQAQGRLCETGEGARRHTSCGGLLHLTWGGTGSFLDGAKYFSLGVCGSGADCGELAWRGAKPWRMWELPGLGSRVAALPAGCLFTWQPDKPRIGKLGNGFWSFQEMGKGHGNRPGKSGNRQK